MGVSELDQSSEMSRSITTEIYASLLSRAQDLVSDPRSNWECSREFARQVIQEKQILMPDSKIPAKEKYRKCFGFQVSDEVHQTWKSWPHGFKGRIFNRCFLAKLLIEEEKVNQSPAIVPAPAPKVVPVPLPDTITTGYYLDGSCLEEVCPLCKKGAQHIGSPVEDEEDGVSTVEVPFFGSCGSIWVRVYFRHEEGVYAKIYRIQQECELVADGYTYFIEAAEANRVKIGFSKDPKARLKQLSSACPYPLKLIAAIPGPKSLEREYHRHFSTYRVQGEWFEMKGALVEYVNQLREWSKNQK